ncbi:uncharacterized protein [Watersipora subatra]|uniref:uncharacterized protein n=1 Tax=Watersipora subatra TaxID=2589382 RepID=UPI00355C3D1D
MLCLSWSLLCLISLIPMTEAAWQSCTPEDQDPEVLFCEYSTKTEDCPDITVGSPGTPLQPVVDIDIYKYLNNVVNYTGVKISWSSPTAAALNATAGYALSLYATNSNGSKELFLCRYFRIYSIREISRQKDSTYKFAYLQTAIPYYSTRIDVELTTLPAQPSLYVPVNSQSSFTTYGNPVDKFQLNGSMAASSLPYTVTAQFRLSSYSSDTRFLYNVTEYLVLLSDPDNFAINHLNGSSVESISIFPDNVTEYAKVTFYSLMPGPYMLQIWPYIKERRCPVLCSTTFDSHQLSAFTVSVAGYDYVPEMEPRLNISNNNRATISFQVAPTYLHIVWYEVILRQSHGSAVFTDREVRPPARNVWYTYEYNLSLVTIMEEFNIITDTIYVEIVPASDSALCDRPGRCNLNGTCTNCTKSFSAPVKVFADSPVSRLPLLSLIVLPILATPIIVLIAIYCRRKRRKQSKQKDMLTLMDTRSHFTVGTGPDEGMLIGPTSLASFIAFAADDRSKNRYEELYQVLSDILSNYFSCKVHRYSDICRRNSSEFQNYNVAIIICTPELCESHQQAIFHAEQDALPLAQLYHQKVMNLLLAPPSHESLRKVLVTFDHIPRCNLDALTKDLPTRPVILSLPSQLKELVLTMYDADDGTEVSSWGFFSSNGKELLEKLVTKIQAVSTFYEDSGYDTATVTTNGQLIRLDQSDIEQVRLEAQLLQDQQEVQQQEVQKQEIQRLQSSPLNAMILPANRVGEGERFLTIVPRAEEMKFLKTLSTDQRSVISVPESTFTIDSLLTVNTEQQKLAVPRQEDSPSAQEMVIRSVASDVVASHPFVSDSVTDQSPSGSAISTCHVTRSDGTEVDRVFA